jgi:hypothetical protein
MPLFASVDRFLHAGRDFGHYYEIVDSRGICAKKKIILELFQDCLKKTGAHAEV